MELFRPTVTVQEAVKLHDKCDVSRLYAGTDK